MDLYDLKKSNNIHIAEIVSIHIGAFPGFFLTDLGKDFLSVFYLALIRDDSTIFWGIKGDSQFEGFFVASSSPFGLYSRLFKKNIFKFFLPLTFAFFKNISLLRRMITSFISLNAYVVPNEYSAVLLSICVSPSSSGKGIGKILLAKLERELALKGHKGYYLTTDKNDNQATNHFYISYGFQLHYVFKQGTREMNVYKKYLE